MPNSTTSLPKVSLAELAGELETHAITVTCTAGAETTEVRGMTVDSREVIPGNLFVCKGAAFKPAFLASAATAGATAYLCSDDPALLDALAEAAPGLPRLAVSDIRRAMAFVAPVIYDHPDRALEIVGITGTKGKSTTACLLCSILMAAGEDPSIMGSIETDDGIEHFESHNTTPEAPQLWRHLRNTVDAGRRHMVMEVSSQGLKYDRMLGVPLAIGVFLNIGRDHISPVEHPDFADYFSSKLKIFDHCRVAVVNLASEHADEILAAAKRAPQVERVVAIDAREGAADADFCVRAIAHRGTSFSFEVIDHEGTHPVELGMVGSFNIENALAAIACARLLDIDYAHIATGLAHVRVPGRMELVSTPDKRLIAVVDYAHNELSFQRLFSSMKQEYPDRRIIAVFGAAGDKAYERREALPRVASQYADLIIYTEEDPGHEPVADICADLARNTPAGTNYRIILDREEAIQAAVDDARTYDGKSLIMLLAKGDETRQHRGNDYPEIKSDLALARELLS